VRTAGPASARASHHEHRSTRADPFAREVLHRVFARAQRGVERRDALAGAVKADHDLVVAERSVGGGLGHADDHGSLVRKLVFKVLQCSDDEEGIVAARARVIA
jgi:hypothetical protein